MQKLEINGREYTVEAMEKLESTSLVPGYILTGKRGATYAAMRNLSNPTHLFVMDRRGHCPLGNVQLTDIDGNLKVEGA